MKTKTFDCVEMKRRGAARVHETLKGMTVAEQVQYWRRRSELSRQRRMARLDKLAGSPASSECHLPELP